MKRTLFFLLLLFIPLISVHAQSDEDCDLESVQRYLLTQLADMEYLNEVASYQSLVQYYQTVTYTRRSYEDMTDLPGLSCTT